MTSNRFAGTWYQIKRNVKKAMGQALPMPGRVNARGVYGYERHVYRARVVFTTDIANHCVANRMKTSNELLRMKLGVRKGEYNMGKVPRRARRGGQAFFQVLPAKQTRYRRPIA